MIVVFSFFFGGGERNHLHDHQVLYWLFHENCQYFYFLKKNWNLWFFDSKIIETGGSLILKQPEPMIL
jgi:hypothetical protein